MAETKIRNEQLKIEDGWIDANETWTYASADDPTYTFTISGDKTGKYSAGMRVKLTQTTAKYFIITAISYSSPNTTVTVYGGTDYDLADEAITSPYYSMVKAPHGFPLSPAKWTEKASSTSDLTQTNPTSGTWYNLTGMSLSIPIGCWNVRYFLNAQTYDNDSPSGSSIMTTLSTANNTESDISTSVYMALTAGYTSGNALGFVRGVNMNKLLSIATKATYYLNIKTDTANQDQVKIRGDLGTTVIEAVCAYL